MTFLAKTSEPFFGLLYPNLLPCKDVPLLEKLRVELFQLDQCQVMLCCDPEKRISLPYDIIFCILRISCFRLGILITDNQNLTCIDLA